MRIIQCILFFSFCIGYPNPNPKNIEISKNIPGCSVEVIVSDLSCVSQGILSNDGSIQVNVSGANGTVTIQWTTTTASVLIPNQREQHSLQAGEYGIEVFDRGVSVYKKTHTVNAPENLAATLTKTDNHCYQGEEGRISISAEGGTPPYRYSIDNGQNFFSTSLFENLTKGSYTVVVKDAKSCLYTEDINITQGAYFSVHHPPSLEVAPCLTQEQINTEFYSWLEGFVYFGGSKPVQETLTYDSIPGPCGGSITVHYKAVDDCGVEKSCEATFSVPAAKSITLLSPAKDLSVSCTEDTEDLLSQWLASRGNAQVSSNCSIRWADNYAENLWITECENSKSITVTFTADNGCDQLKTRATFSIGDKDAPVLNILPKDMVVSCQNIPGPEVITAKDNCDQNIQVVYKEEITQEDCTQNIQRTWTATDCSGNSTTHSQVIQFVQDEEAPTLSANSPLEQNISVQCGDIPPVPELAFEDQCSTELTIDFNENSAPIKEDGSYLITRNWTVTDECSNASIFTQTISVVPNLNFQFSTLPQDLSLQCGSIPAPEVLIATNDCNSSIPVTFYEQTGSDNCTPTIERTWTATDELGNTLTHTQTIKVVDKEAPTFVEALPEDLILNCAALPEPTVLTAVDNCGNSIEVNFEETSGTEGCTQNIQRTWTATDCSGNSTTHTQQIQFIQDNQAPVLTAASLENFQTLIRSNCNNIPPPAELYFQDDCSNEISVHFEETSTYVNNQTDYSLIRSWEVTDACNNQTIYTQTIEVEQQEVSLETAQLMLCTEDFPYDLNNLFDTDELPGLWTLSSEEHSLNGSFIDPSLAAIGVYRAYFIPEDACTPKREVTINVHNDCVVLPCNSSNSIAVSKAITPNGDSYNEYFTVSGLEDCGFTLELIIFNRWGAKVYESMDYQNNWNAFNNSGGSHFVPSGTYYYILTVVDSGFDPIKGYLFVGTTSN